MSKFKALIRKDFAIAKKTLFQPMWITAGLYALILLSMGIAGIKGDFPKLMLSNFQNLDIPRQGISYLAGYTVLGFAGILSLIFTIMITQSSLNEDLRLNFELFHRTQPVTVWQRTLSKFSVGVLGNWFIMILIGIFNFIISSGILIYFHGYSFGYGFIGFLQSVLVYLKFGILLGSIAFFCSAIFRDKAFFKGLAILAGLNLLFLIVNFWFGWNLPMPLEYFKDLFHVEIFPGDTSLLGDITDISNVNAFILDRWKALFFNWQVLLQMVVSAILFVGGVFIYNRKEVK